MSQSSDAVHDDVITVCCYSWSNAQLDLKDGDKVGPITLFPATRSGRVGLVSPFSEFMSWSMYHDKNNSRLNFGMLGEADMIPRGMLPWQMFYYGNQGVNKVTRGSIR